MYVCAHVYLCLFTCPYVHMQICPCVQEYASLNSASRDLWPRYSRTRVAAGCQEASNVALGTEGSAAEHAKRREQIWTPQQPNVYIVLAATPHGHFGSAPHRLDWLFLSTAWPPSPNNCQNPVRGSYTERVTIVNTGANRWGLGAGLECRQAPVRASPWGFGQSPE